MAIAIAGLLAFVAFRAGALSRSGAVAATVVGALALAAGAAWGRFLLLWFIMTSALSRAGRNEKQRRTAGMVAKHDQRDVWQVFANGGVYAGAALWTQWYPEQHGLAAMIGAGALVAAGADTIATEIGTRWGGTPRSVRTGRRLPAGSSGAVSLAGSAAMVIGAMLLAVGATLTGLVATGAVPRPYEGSAALKQVLVLAAAGTVGALVDTIAGAWIQERRRCPQCEHLTEQDVHECGTRTLLHSGVPWMNNDSVNLLCTLTGGAVAGAGFFLMTHR